MKLSQLRYFQAACRCGGVTAAAELLHLSQPSVTAAIKELESEFGLALLDRKRRGFSLTKEGQLLLEQADSLLAHADRVESVMADLSRQTRQLRLGVPPMIGALLLPRLYREFFSENPDLPVVITEGGRRELMRLLDENPLDLVFLPHDRPLDPSCRAAFVTQLETVFCVSRDHPLAGRTEMKIEDLAREPLVLFKNSFFQTETIAQRFQALNLTPNILLHTDQLSTVRRLISSGVAGGFLFRDLVTEHDGMVSISLSPAIRVTVSLVWKSGGSVFRDMGRLIDYVQQMSSGNPITAASGHRV